MSMMQWVRSFIRYKRISDANKLAVEWKTKSDRLVKVLEYHQRNLDALKISLEQLSRRVDSDLVISRELQSQHDTAMDALRNENRILNDTVVKTLVASHQLLLQRYDAEIAVQARRQVTATPDEE